MRMGIGVALSLAVAGTAQAQAPMADHEAEQCAAAAPLPPELAGWAQPSALTAATALPAAMLPVGRRADVALTRTADVRYVVRPEKPGGSVSYGGLLGLTIAEPGTYRIALDSGAWLDVLKGRTAQVSVAHGRGPACTGVRKMVDFRLQPGRYVLQVAANGQPAIAVLVAKLP